MKYIRLTKEQLEELHPEFITFLATQSIDKKEWDELKANKPEIAEQEIDVFSDMIWDRAITNVNFIDHFSKNYIFLFKCVDSKVYSYVVNLDRVEKFNSKFAEIDGQKIPISRNKKDVISKAIEAI
uniref:DUF6495 family protein n=1 Tax=Flavobacterium sp. TaxID=239 RepID=UPI004047F6E2